ncbi:MAG: DUF5060 domain-containing protein, partial [Verrucomicrobiota bacterium]
MFAILSGSLSTSLFAKKFEHRTGTLWYPHLEWKIENPDVSGNPYDVIASAEFVHVETGEKRRSLMFRDADGFWKFRFTGIRIGDWKFETESEDTDLNGHTGRVTIIPNPNPDAYGFITSIESDSGTKWAREKGNKGEVEAFVPHVVMWGENEKTDPKLWYNQPAKIDLAIEEFIENHGFQGFHLSNLASYWFDLDSWENFSKKDQNPDPRTFEAVEQLLKRTHQSGGVVSLTIWWQKGQIPHRLEGGVGSKVDQRMQRYLAARLGPLPGWFADYGVDLNEWTKPEETREWRDSIHEKTSWPLWLSGRSQGPNSSTDHRRDS